VYLLIQCRYRGYCGIQCRRVFCLKIDRRILKSGPLAHDSFVSSYSAWKSPMGQNHSSVQLRWISSWYYPLIALFPASNDATFSTNPTF
jgi:hypothetical protein